MSLKDALQAIKPARVPVTFGEDTVYVRQRTKAEKLEHLVKIEELTGKPHELLHYLAEQIIKACEDEAGVPVWVKDDVENVVGLAEGVFDRLLNTFLGVQDPPPNA